LMRRQQRTAWLLWGRCGVSRCPGDPPPQKTFCNLYHAISPLATLDVSLSFCFPPCIKNHLYPLHHHFTKKHLNILYIITFCSIAFFLWLHRSIYFIHMRSFFCCLFIPIPCICLPKSPDFIFTDNSGGIRRYAAIPSKGRHCCEPAFIWYEHIGSRTSHGDFRSSWLVTSQRLLRRKFRALKHFLHHHRGGYIIRIRDNLFLL